MIKSTQWGLDLGQILKEKGIIKVTVSRKTATALVFNPLRTTLFRYRKVRVLGLNKSSKFDLFQKCQNRNLYFWIFSKNSFRNGLQSPFYPILIPNTPYVKFSLLFFLVVGGGPRESQNQKRFFYDI